MLFFKKENIYQDRLLKEYRKEGYIYKLNCGDLDGVMDFLNYYGNDFEVKSCDQFLFFKTESDRTAAMLLV